VWGCRRGGGFGGGCQGGWKCRQGHCRGITQIPAWIVCHGQRGKGKQTTRKPCSTSGGGGGGEERVYPRVSTVDAEKKATQKRTKGGGGGGEGGVVCRGWGGGVGVVVVLVGLCAVVCWVWVVGRAGGPSGGGGVGSGSQPSEAKKNKRPEEGVGEVDQKGAEFITIPLRARGEKSKPRRPAGQLSEGKKALYGAKWEKRSREKLNEKDTTIVARDLGLNKKTPFRVVWGPDPCPFSWSRSPGLQGYFFFKWPCYERKSPFSCNGGSLPPP